MHGKGNKTWTLKAWFMVKPSLKASEINLNIAQGLSLPDS